MSLSALWAEVKKESPVRHAGGIEAGMGIGRERVSGEKGTGVFVPINIQE